MDKVIGIRKMVLSIFGLLSFTLIKLVSPDVPSFELGIGIGSILFPAAVGSLGEWWARSKGAK